MISDDAHYLYRIAASHFFSGSCLDIKEQTGQHAAPLYWWCELYNTLEVQSPNCWTESHLRILSLK